MIMSVGLAYIFEENNEYRLNSRLLQIFLFVRCSNKVVEDVSIVTQEPLGDVENNLLDYQSDSMKREITL